ncbi:hypothetical protein CJ030_MR1G005823 [Morella rubra]|uniref:B3 domain-containing protein n=1 Tax=Morella rubra TaxID=262757 RepID=A0A6A1WNS2_9ROSI|nr:hypothetical protein CJ030_MR1G005823 [Morella rubra]
MGNMKLPEDFWFLNHRPFDKLLLLAIVSAMIAEEEESSFLLNPADVSSARQERLKNEKLLKKPISTEALAMPPKQISCDALNFIISTKKTSIQSKRSYDSIQGDSDFKIHKKSKKNEGQSGIGPKKGPNVDVTDFNPNPPSELPEEFKHRIQELAGTEVTMVIQKTLTKTDLKKENSRLSMPFGQIKVDFLREGEKHNLGQGRTMEVPFLETSQAVDKMILKQWNMPKDSGNTSSIYALRTYWNDVVRNNELKPGNVVQIWSFRVGNADQLCLALVVACREGSSTLGSDNELVGSSSGSGRGKGKGNSAHADAN